MAWKIIFSYNDGSQLKASKNQKKLPKDLAEHYQKLYAKPNNNGGMVYISPYNTCEPMTLDSYIAKVQ